MTTAEFIKKTYNTTNEKWGKHGYDRWCSSVRTDKHGNVYSYGSHYPLAFHVAGLDFVNDAGYSSTTSKHIGWAKQAIGYNNYTSVKLWREEARVIADEYATEQQKLEAIKTALKREYDDWKEQVESKKRKDTQIYEYLHSQMVDAGARLEKVASC